MQEARGRLIGFGLYFLGERKARALLGEVGRVCVAVRELGGVLLVTRDLVEL